MQTEKLVYETNEYTYIFKNFQTIKTFGRDIYDGSIMLKEADEYQNDKLILKKGKRRKLFLKTFIYIFFLGGVQRKIFDAFESKICLTKSKGSGFLTPRQMLQRLPIALVQVKAGNNLESLLN